VGIGGPGEGLWVLVGLGEEPVNGRLEVDDALEDAALEARCRVGLAKNPLPA